MMAPALLNLVKSSLKSFYDIDPLVVDHMLISAKLQAKIVGARSAEMVCQAQQAVRSSFSVQPLGTFSQ